MLDILKFVFSSFWIWLGTLILIVAAGNAINGVVRVFITRK